MQSKSNNQMDDPELRKIVSRTVSVPACVATAGTSLIIGYVKHAFLLCDFIFCFDIFMMSIQAWMFEELN